MRSDLRERASDDYEEITMPGRESESTVITCRICAGRGSLGHHEQRVPCPTCRGTGKVISRGF